MSERLPSESQRFTPQPRPSLSLWTTAVLLLVSSLLTYFLGVCVGRRFPGNLGATRHVSKYCKSVTALGSGQELTAKLCQRLYWRKLKSLTILSNSMVPLSMRTSIARTQDLKLMLRGRHWVLVVSSLLIYDGLMRCGRPPRGQMLLGLRSPIGDLELIPYSNPTLHGVRFNRSHAHLSPSLQY
jgi:hypothetical protein